jgi:hypothetical protein
MRHYKIVTPYGGWYKINERGMVYASDNGFKCDPVKGDGHQWDIIGGTSTHPFARLQVVPIHELASMSSKELLYKNGHPRYTIVDIDHGTMRVHGNTKVRGIKSIDVVIV